jgi:hypothetical protein
LGVVIYAGWLLCRRLILFHGLTDFSEGTDVPLDCLQHVFPYLRYPVEHCIFVPIVKRVHRAIRGVITEEQPGVMLALSRRLKAGEVAAVARIRV